MNTIITPKPAKHHLATPTRAKKMSSRITSLFLALRHLLGRISIKTRNAGMTRELAYVEVAIEEAFRAEMSRLMAGALAAGTPEVHREWLATAQQLLDQYRSALAWRAEQKASCLSQPAPPRSVE